MDISVIIPVYNEEAALPELYQALADILDRR
jgi:glycosyltransferase involved in cell wall biosynthesis